MSIFALMFGLLWPWLFSQPSQSLNAHFLAGLTREQNLLLLEHGPAVCVLALRMNAAYLSVAFVLAVVFDSVLDVLVRPPLRRWWLRYQRDRRRRASCARRLAEGKGL